MGTTEERQAIFEEIWQELTALHLRWHTFLALYGKDPSAIEVMKQTARIFILNDSSGPAR